MNDGWTSIPRNIRALLARAGELGIEIDNPYAVGPLADFMKMEEIRARVDEIVTDEGTAAALKPWYDRFCKRPCFHDEYLPAFNRANVTLVDTQGQGVERVTAKGVVANGREYCSQSMTADSGVKATKLMDVREVLQCAARAKDNGSQRFCMGSAWRNPKDRDMPAIVAMVKGVRAMGLETCMTLGMLEPHQADQLAETGLDYYNHNIDTSPERYGEVITTRTMNDRLLTLENVRAAGMNVCSGGTVGMGETRDDRVGFIHTLATLPQHPESVPVNALVPVKGTVLGDMLADTPLAKIDDIEFVRTVAVARITMAMSMVRLSAGRESMSESTQALCFLAGANSIFTGDKLLTAPNAGDDNDAAMFARLGLKPLAGKEPMRATASDRSAAIPAR